MINEADTCRKYVLPKLIAAGWDNDRRSFTEQKTFTDGRIVLIGEKVRRRPQKRADYLLRYTRDFVIAVVEAKAAYKSPSDGLQQAKDYAEVLGLKFAYATNGHGIVEFDFLRVGGAELTTPDDLWQPPWRETQSDTAAERLLTPTPSLRKEPSLLPGHCHQSNCAIDLARQASHSPDNGDRHRENGRRVSDLLEAVAGALEQDRRIPSQNPLPGRPEHFDRRPKDKFSPCSAMRVGRSKTAR
jgi:hypothetical protein